MFRGQFLFLPELCRSVWFSVGCLMQNWSVTHSNIRLYSTLWQALPNLPRTWSLAHLAQVRPILESWNFSCFGPTQSNCCFIVRAGKTVTMVEAIKQIEKKEAACHILACAPSNSAADLLCKKILEHVDKHSVFRMYASSRDPQMVPVELKVSVALFHARCLAQGGCVFSSKTTNHQTD